MSDLVADYINVKAEREAIEAVLRPVVERMHELEDALAADFTSKGKQSEKRNGTTVYLARKMNAKVQDRPKLVEAMRALGHDEMLTVNANSLGAFLRDLLHDDKVGEWVADDARLPAELRGTVTVTEYHKIQARKS